MRSGRWLWLGLAVAELGLLFGWNHWLVFGRGVAPADAQLSYGVGFALFGVLMIGTLARFRVTSYPAFWRMLTVLVGAGMAAVEVKLHGYPRTYFFPLWAAALVGLSVVSVAARFLPRRLLSIWLAGETD
jgi:hypothetical protein